jgi:hypothetical protein
MANEFKIRNGLISEETASFEGEFFSPELVSNNEVFLAISGANDTVVKSAGLANSIDGNNDNYLLTSVGTDYGLLGNGQFQISGSNAGADTNDFATLRGSISFSNDTTSSRKPNTNIHVSSSIVANSSSVTLFQVSGSNSSNPGFDALTMDYVIVNNTRTKSVFGTLQAGWAGNPNPTTFQRLETRTTGISLPSSQFVLSVTSGVSPNTDAVRVVATNTAGETMYIAYERTLFGTDNIS